MLIDGLMGKNYLHYLKSNVENISYNTCFNTSGINTKENEPWTFSFSSPIYLENEYKHEYGDYIFTILLTALDHQNEELLNLSRIRLGLIFRTPTVINHGEHLDFGNEFFINNKSKCRTGLYYINDSDGDTNVYKEKFSTLGIPEKFTLKKSISPVENRWYDFNGERYHNSNSPIENNHRLVLTFNYTIK
jgi:hypothetical protein